MPSIADLYSTIDSYKRRASDVLSDPQNSLMQMLGFANDRSREFNQNLNQSIGVERAKIRGEQPTLADLRADKYITDEMANSVMGGMFVGEKASIWNKDAAEKFLKLEEKGVSPADAWKQTGTFRSPDGRLRQEMSDLSAKGRANLSPEEMDRELNLTAKLIHGKDFKDLDLKAKNAIKNDLYESQSKLPSNLVHPDLYQAYPSLRNIESTGELTPGAQTTGKYYKTTVNDQLKNESISGNAPDLENLKSTFLHEAQHAIQQREGFATGASSEGPYPAGVRQQIIKDQYEQLKEHNKYDPSNPYSSPNGLTDEELMNMAIRNTDQENGVGRMQAYRRSAGEAEARATQARMNMTPEERLNTFPLESYDVSPDKLFINTNLNPHSQNYLEDLHTMLGLKSKDFDISDVYSPTYLGDLHSFLSTQKQP